RVLAHHHAARAFRLSREHDRVVPQIREIVEGVVLLRILGVHADGRLEVVGRPAERRASRPRVVDHAGHADGHERLSIGLDPMRASGHGWGGDHAGHSHLDQTVAICPEHGSPTFLMASSLSFAHPLEIAREETNRKCEPASSIDQSRQE
ncbi:MAG TPA: hypothetical protein VFM35_11965, partial [Candidatus Binatia bacterium]|nr:hypothetical protein [Candidatus Binatia bacterium]